jgi:hypothetical protein
MGEKKKHKKKGLLVTFDTEIRIPPLEAGFLLYLTIRTPMAQGENKSGCIIVWKGRSPMVYQDRYFSSFI